MRGDSVIQIIPADNGYIVDFGGHRLVFEQGERLLSELARWMAAPRAVEKEYAEKYSLRSTAPGTMGVDTNAGAEAPRPRDYYMPPPKEADRRW